jgi:hypothetical protein
MKKYPQEKDANKLASYVLSMMQWSWNLPQAILFSEKLVLVSGFVHRNFLKLWVRIGLFLKTKLANPKKDVLILKIIHNFVICKKFVIMR